MKVHNTLYSKQEGYLLASLVSLIFGLITALLAVRFLLTLLDANMFSNFASNIFMWSQPIVEPFYNLFPRSGDIIASRVELPTLLAMVVYGSIASIAQHSLGYHHRAH